MFEVVAYTGGLSVPSARFRVRQFIEPLGKHGVRLNEIYSRATAYPPNGSNLRRLAWAAHNVIEHAVAIPRSYTADATLLQREFLSGVPTLERMTRRPIVLDVDDAIWLRRGGRCARVLARLANRIICGNAFLADWFSHHNSRIEIVPTSVDTNYFRPPQVPVAREHPVIVWSGSSSGLRYLEDVEEAIAEVFRAHPGCRLRVVCDAQPLFRLLPPERVEFWPWSQAIELRALQEADIGIMPLRDSEWERGKCSFKMLTYMATGIPSVVSNVGMNVEVLRHGEMGLGATSKDEWIDALSALVASHGLRERMGAKGRQVAQSVYSVETNAALLARLIREA
jgi:glycosyltransferase involved in cell wall biosynthesis